MPYRIPNRKDWLVTALVIGIFIAALIAGVFLIGRNHPVGFALLAGAMLLMLVHWHAATTGYRCQRCGNEFEISTLNDLLSPHTPNTKYLRCPKCGERSWADVLKKV